MKKIQTLTMDQSEMLPDLVDNEYAKSCYKFEVPITESERDSFYFFRNELDSLTANVKNFQYKGNVMEIVCDRKYEVEVRGKLEELKKKINAEVQSDEIILENENEIKLSDKACDKAQLQFKGSVLTISEGNIIKIMALDYANVQTVKLAIQVSIGKVKPTARCNRDTKQENSPLEPSGANSLKFEKQDCKLKIVHSLIPPYNIKGLTVYVYVSSITDVGVEGIASAANGYLGNTVGVAKVISMAAGKEFGNICKKEVQTCGKLKTAECRSMSAGDLPFKHVLHVVGPEKPPDRNSYAEKLDQLTKAVLNCLILADKLGLKSIAIPCFSAGTSGFPIDICALQYFRALVQFKGTTLTPKLQEVHIVDIEKSKIERIQTIFNYMRNSGGQSYNQSFKWTPISSVPSVNQPHVPIKNERLGRSRSKDADQPSGHLLDVSVGVKNSSVFNTPGGKVRIYIAEGDITRVFVDAIVCTENEHFSGKGAIAGQIWKMAGVRHRTYYNEEKGKPHAIASVTAIAVEDGSMMCQYVLYAVAPHWTKDYTTRPQDFSRDLRLTVDRILTKASELHIQKVAVSLMGTSEDENVRPTPLATCCNAMVDAILNFVIDRPSGTEISVKEVMILGTDPTAVHIFKTELEKQLGYQGISVKDDVRAHGNVKRSTIQDRDNTWCKFDEQMTFTSASKIFGRKRRELSKKQEDEADKRVLLTSVDTRTTAHEEGQTSFVQPPIASMLSAYPIADKHIQDTADASTVVENVPDNIKLEKRGTLFVLYIGKVKIILPEEMQKAEHLYIEEDLLCVDSDVYDIKKNGGKYVLEKICIAGIVEQHTFHGEPYRKETISPINPLMKPASSSQRHKHKDTERTTNDDDGSKLNKPCVEDGQHSTKVKHNNDQTAAVRNTKPAPEQVEGDASKDDQTFQRETAEDVTADVDNIKPTQILVSNLPSTAHEDFLEMFFENKKKYGGGDVKSVEVDEENSSAVVEFEEPEAVEIVLQKIPIRMLGCNVAIEIYRPEPEVPIPLHTIEVRGPPEYISEDMLEIYFENTRRSGGDDIEKIEVDDEEHVAYVTFKDDEVAQRVIDKGNHKINKKAISVRLHEPVKVKKKDEADGQVSVRIMAESDCPESIQMERQADDRSSQGQMTEELAAQHECPDSIQSIRVESDRAEADTDESSSDEEELLVDNFELILRHKNKHGGSTSRVLRAESGEEALKWRYIFQNQDRADSFAQKLVPFAATLEYEGSSNACIETDKVVKPTSFLRNIKLLIESETATLSVQETLVGAGEVEKVLEVMSLTCAMFETQRVLRFMQHSSGQTRLWFVGLQDDVTEVMELFKQTQGYVSKITVGNITQRKPQQ